MKRSFQGVGVQAFKLVLIAAVKVKLNPEKKLTPIAPTGYFLAEARSSTQSNE
jgi:hypothetical protein